MKIKRAPQLVNPVMKNHPKDSQDKNIRYKWGFTQSISFLFVNFQQF
jgi:hypothetical protein